VSRGALRFAAGASLAGVAVVWGATFPIAKVVLRFLPPFQYLGLRFTLAALLLLPLSWNDLRMMPARHVRAGCLTGLVLFGAYALQTLGLQHTTAGKAGLITGLNVVIVPLLLLVWIRRVPDVLTQAGITVAASGLWLLSWHGGSLSPGDALVAGCAVALALHLILVGRWATAVPPAGFAVLQVGTVALLAVLAGLLFEPRPVRVPAGVGWAIVFMAVAATLAAYLTQSWAQRTVSPVRTGLLFTMEPVAAVGFGALWLGEGFSPRQAVGAAAILAGVACGEISGRRSTPLLASIRTVRQRDGRRDRHGG